MAPEMMAGMVAAGASQEPTLPRAHLANHTPYIFKNTGQKILKNMVHGLPVPCMDALVVHVLVACAGVVSACKSERVYGHSPHARSLLYCASKAHARHGLHAQSPPSESSVLHLCAPSLRAGACAVHAVRLARSSSV